MSEQLSLVKPRARRAKKSAWPVPYEHDEQRLLVQWLTNKRIPFFAVPNEAKRRPWLAKRMQAQGMVSGAPDIVLVRQAITSCGHHPIVVEMKRSKGGTVSDTQKEMHEKMRGHGWIVVVAMGFDDAKRQLEELGY